MSSGCPRVSKRVVTAVNRHTWGELVEILEFFYRSDNMGTHSTVKYAYNTQADCFSFLIRVFFFGVSHLNK